MTGDGRRRPPVSHRDRGGEWGPGWEKGSLRDPQHDVFLRFTMVVTFLKFLLLHHKLALTSTEPPVH